jgi:hypothetical protein
VLEAGGVLGAGVLAAGVLGVAEVPEGVESDEQSEPKPGHETPEKYTPSITTKTITKHANKIPIIITVCMFI